ncbi:MAG TPA: protein kinase [Streptosporangiaceae bacterium]|nr:protein kinase [Streptosporangiaceae bacterium]
MTGSNAAERYEIVKRLGEGGMGSVWLAWDTLLHRHVAIKKMRIGRVPAEHNRAVSAARVLREARALSRLSHPNIVGVIELLERDEGPWIVMEYVEGRSLADWIATWPARLTEDKVAEIGLTVLDALKAAHASGVLHRDVKPANILIKDMPGSLTSRIRLVDFGNAAMEGHDLTTLGNVIGTLPYVAPERFNRATGPASDLWSLGVTLYEAAERRLPFQREDQILVYKAILDEAPDQMKRAPLLAPLVSRLLEKDPARRPRPDEVTLMLRRVIASRREVRDEHEARDRRDGRVRPSPAAPNDDAPDGPPPAPSGASGPATGFAAVAALSPKEAAAVLRKQGPRQAALLLGRMATRDPRGVTATFRVMDDGFAAELLRQAEPAAAAMMLLGLPAQHGARLLVQVSQVSPPSATGIIMALPARDAATARLMNALAPGDAARLLNDTPPEHVVALTAPYDRRRITAVLAEMNPRKAAGVLDLAPADPRAAVTVLRGLPGNRVGLVLDRMDAARVAAILQVEPAADSRFLKLMRPEAAWEVIEQMDRPGGPGGPGGADGADAGP